MRHTTRPCSVYCHVSSVLHLPLVFAADSLLSSKQTPQLCPGSEALDPFATQNNASSNVPRNPPDVIQSPSRSHAQPQSFLCPPPSLYHHTQPQVHNNPNPNPQTQPALIAGQSNPQHHPPHVPAAHPPPQSLPPRRSHRQHSKSTSSASLSPRALSPHLSCSWARGASRPPSVLLPLCLYDIITASDSSGLPRCTSFLPHMSVTWASSFR